MRCLRCETQSRILGLKDPLCTGREAERRRLHSEGHVIIIMVDHTDRGSTGHQRRRERLCIIHLLSPTTQLIDDISIPFYRGGNQALSGEVTC